MHFGILRGKGIVCSNQLQFCLIPRILILMIFYPLLYQYFMPEPTPVFLPGKSPGQRSLAGYSPWGNKELDMTECV